MTELLHFTADWCQPCKAMAPIIDKFLEENQEIIYTKVNVDTDILFVKEYGITSVPTLIVRKDGEVTNRHTGAVAMPKLKSLFE